MVKKILMMLTLSTLGLVSAKAEMNEELKSHSVPRTTPKQVAYDLYEGTTHIAKGTSNVMWGLGSLSWDTEKLVSSFVKTTVSATHAVVAPMSYFYANEATCKSHVAKAEDYAKSAWEDTKAGIGNLPTTYKYFKDGLTQGFEGCKKIAKSSYEGMRELANSERVQSASKAIYSASSAAFSKGKSFLNSVWTNLNSAFDFTYKIDDFGYIG